MTHSAAADSDIIRTYALLGGEDVIKRPVRNNIEAHDLLMTGLPTAALLYLLSQIVVLKNAGILDKAFGISTRTLQRRKKDAGDKILSTEQSNRAWKFAEILGRATEVLGSNEDAELWMNSPVIGLDLHKPIDLLATSAGLEALENYLTRIEHGVYA